MSSCWRLVAATLVAAIGLFLMTPARASAQQESSGVPVLLYHRFGPVAGSTTVTTAVFAGQLVWLREHDRRIIPLRAVVDSLRNPSAALPPGAVAITADDDHQSVSRRRSRLKSKAATFPASARSPAISRCLCGTA